MNIRQERVQKEVALMLQNYRTTKEKECIQKAYEEANHLVDSILIEEAKNSSLMLHDTLFTDVNRPYRPAKPVVKMPKDTDSVKPLF